MTLVKCLVWDLDDTLWRGVLVEDGDVRLHEAVLHVVTTLDSRGILQSVASKNDHDLAWAKLCEFGLEEYFLVPKIGWGAKSASIASIADELRFAPSTIAFIDDQPAERAEVGYHLPDVRCYPAEELANLVNLPEFSPAMITADSARRREMYRASQLRAASQAEFSGPDEDFLRTLGIELRIDRASGEHLARVEELTLRTSQMNATGIHYSGDDLSALLADPAHEVLVATMTDRFGPHGAIGVLLIEKLAAAWNLKLLATSCRVVSFGAGAAILNWLGGQAARAGVHLVADFRRTERNRMMEIAYRFAGFTAEERCPCIGSVSRVAGVDGLQRLHLVPEPAPAPDTLRLVAPDLTASEVKAAAS